MKFGSFQSFMCVTNKPKSLRDDADQLNQYFQDNFPNKGYQAVVDLEHNK